MTLKSYLLNLFLGTIFILSILSIFIIFIRPDEFVFGVMMAFVIFYLLFFLGIAGLSILSLTWLWKKMSGESLEIEDVGMAVRQGILMGILMTILMFFQQMGILIWWDALLVIAGIMLVEFYFLSRD